ncbi:MAG: GNAT family N-acetyltransferase [Streptomycetaceae bacterium]|nr:GNAT family N-acetyltransferase [Streptomycetaceae bacterium]
MDANALSYRTAKPADIPLLVALIESAYRGDSSRKGWTTEADLLHGQRTDAEGVADVVNSQDGVMLLAVPAGPDGTPVACCQLERRPEGVAYFGMFAVDPDRQGDGLGRALLAEAERTAAADWGCGAMHMTVIRQREDLISWYVRRGYTRTGRMTPFPYGDERFGLPQVPDLEFELLVKPLVKD